MSDKDQNNINEGDKAEIKESFGRKHLNPIRDVTNIVISSNKQAQQDIEFTKSASSEFLRRFKNMFVTRREKPKKEDLKDFESLLRFWAINEQDLPKVKKNMRATIFAVLFMIVVAALGLIQASSLYFYILLCTLIVCGLLRIILIFWQLWVLNRGHYVSFKDWLTLNF